MLTSSAIEPVKSRRGTPMKKSELRMPLDPAQRTKQVRTAAARLAQLAAI